MSSRQKRNLIRGSGIVLLWPEELSRSSSKCGIAELQILSQFRDYESDLELEAAANRDRNRAGAFPYREYLWRASPPLGTYAPEDQLYSARRPRPDETAIPSVLPAPAWPAQLLRSR